MEVVYLSQRFSASQSYKLFPAPGSRRRKFSGSPVSLSKRQKWADLAAQKYIFEDKGRGELMHVRSWMKAVPEDVIIWVVIHKIHKQGTVERLVSEPRAVRKVKPCRLKNHRGKYRVNIHKVDPDLVCKGHSR